MFGKSEQGATAEFVEVLGRSSTERCATRKKGTDESNSVDGGGSAVGKKTIMVADADEIR